jgi:hypothetical protein
LVLCVNLGEGTDPVFANHVPGGHTDLGCRADDSTKLSAGGTYTYMIGMEAQRASVERVAGVTFQPLSRAQPAAPLYLLAMRDTREGVRTEASQLTFKAAGPTCEARYEQLREVAAVGTAPFRPGPRFYVSPPSNGLMTHYTWGRRGLLKLLATRGVNVRFKLVRLFYARLLKTADGADGPPSTTQMNPSPSR